MEDLIRTRTGLTIKLCDEIPRLEQAIFPNDLKCHDAQGRCTALDKSAVAKAYIERNQLETFEGMLYSPDGPINNDQAESELMQTLNDLGYRNGLPQATAEILKLVKAFSFRPGMPVPNPMIVPFADGDLNISTWAFHRGKKSVTPYRFPLNFPREYSDCPLWKEFLSQLLSTDDIKTLQVFLGYALTPCTDAQSLIVLKGQAGSGKSQIVPVIKAIWGGSYTSIHLHRMLERFGLISVVNRLILIDDDLSQTWLEDTSTLKKLVGTEGELQIERKGADLFSYRSYSKLVTCTNFELQAMHDDSEGFARRILPIDVVGKRHEPGESIGQRIAEAETEGVLLWILEGLRQWQQTRAIPISERTKANQRKLITDRDSLHSFCYCCLLHDPKSSLSTEELYQAYARYCEREELKRVRNAFNLNGFGYELGKILPRMGFEPGRVGTTVRRKGYKGVRLSADAQ